MTAPNRAADHRFGGLSAFAAKVSSMHGATQSAVIVTVPAAEDAVARHRARFDRAAEWGVPAHVTVLYPFAPPSGIDARVVEALAAAIAAVPMFHVTFETTGWFGTDAVWLDPQPAGPFRALTSAVADVFPAYPPYGGEHDEVIPHLTVGHGVGAGALRKAEEQVLRLLPIHMDVTAAALWCGTDTAGSWRQAATFPLG